MDPKIQKLIDAGMKIVLTKENIDALSQLSDEQVDQLVAILQGLATGGGALVLTSDFPSIQPPTM